MNHWLAALERMAAYEVRMSVSHRGKTGKKRSAARDTDAESENSGLEQYLFSAHAPSWLFMDTVTYQWRR